MTATNEEEITGNTQSTEAVTPKKTKSGKKKKKKTSASAKSVETMFRNAYRAQLDMLALAATKANIMISLNGVIVSILMVTGGFIYANTPIFLLPAILFLVTSAISIYFALSAASPSPAPAHTRVFCCFRDVLKGKASLRDFKDYVILPEKRFDKETSNILIFHDFAKLSRDTYLQYMSDLIKDPDEIYEKMSDHLYRLGLVADEKFSMLRYSYSVFRWGLILSILFFLVLKASQHYFPENKKNISTGVSTDLSTKQSTAANSIPVLKFKNIYEPSGVQQLADGRLLVIEDEPEKPFHILELKKDGRISQNNTLSMLFRLAFSKRLNDLEAITTSPDGYIYAATSHKRNKKGVRQAEREQLIRFKIEGTKIINIGVVDTLHDAIEESGILGKVDEHGKGGIYNLNIEALSFDKKNKLMICLRNPQINGKSIILTLENPTAIFEKKEAPKISKTPILLDLQGGGFRAMSYDPKLKGYLFTNDKYTHGYNNFKHSQISFWKGTAEHQPTTFKLPSPINLNNIEGITPVTINGESKILLISDNGDLKTKRSANYLFLEYEQLTN